MMYISFHQSVIISLFHLACLFFVIHYKNNSNSTRALIGHKTILHERIYVNTVFVPLSLVVL